MEKCKVEIQANNLWQVHFSEYLELNKSEYYQVNKAKIRHVSLEVGYI